MSSPLRAPIVAALPIVAVIVNACGVSAPASSSPSGLSGTNTVFAASSLSDSYTTTGKDFQKANPGTMVKFTFGGSSMLVSQIQQGAIGDADAGIVYVTDVKAAGNRVQGVGIPSDVNVVADYPVAVLMDSQNPDLAKAFISYLLGDGERTLTRYGFTSP